MKLNKNDLNNALRILADGADLFVPGEVSGISRFVLWKDGIDLAGIGGKNTELPPKDILFPQTEKMYAYRTGADAQIWELAQNPKQVVFGVRPCDMESIGRLDLVFLGKEYEDSFYVRKRKNTTFVAIVCQLPGETCFCDSMDVDPNAAPAADLLLSDEGDAYFVSAQSDKGGEVAELWKDLLGQGSGRQGNTACALKTKMGAGLPRKLAGMFEHPIWVEASQACIGCATCTYICPTCYCFDIGLESHGNEGVNFRCWDSCMFSSYTQMAGGHNPRPTKKERIRNRYMHKLSYFQERHDKLLCVGCGRCLDKCPAHLDITELIDKAAEVVL